MRIEVYTAITNKKDTRKDDTRVFFEFAKFVNTVYNAKYYKVLPHKVLDCDVSVWMDGNIYLLRPKEEIVKEWLGDADMAMFRHYKSKNIEWELKWIKYKFGRHSEQSKEAERQVEYYQSLGLPNKDEMAMGGFIIRRHIPRVNRFNEAWWAEICARGERDQLSFPIVKREFPDVKLNLIDEDIKNNSYLRYEPHNYDIPR